MTDTGMYATAPRACSERLRYGEACLRQGLSYQASAKAAGINEIDLRSYLAGFRPVRRDAPNSAAPEPAPTALSLSASIIDTATPEECAQIAALAIATIHQRSGLNVARFTVANIMTSIPSLLPDDVTPTSRIRAHEVAEYVAAMHGRTLDDLASQRRTVAFARPRQIAMHCIKQLCPHMSYPAIGRILGGRDHSTVMHGERRIADLVQRDPETADAVAKVFDWFGGRAA